jgi:hypothetical protein
MPDGVSTTGVVGPLAEMVTASPGKPFKAIDEVGGIECAGREGASGCNGFSATAGVSFSGDG